MDLYFLISYLEKHAYVLITCENFYTKQYAILENRCIIVCENFLI